jgi:hypothetical protein
LHPQNRHGDAIRFFGKGSRERITPLDQLTLTALIAL